MVLFFKYRSGQLLEFEMEGLEKMVETGKQLGLSGEELIYFIEKREQLENEKEKKRVALEEKQEAYRLARETERERGPRV